MNREQLMRGEHKQPQGIPVRAHIMVATPTHSGSVAHECAQTMHVASIYCLMQGIVLEWQFAAAFSLVQCGRNWLLAEFLSRPEFTHLLWLDDDLGFEPNAIVKLLDSGKDAVGGVYLTKHPDPAKRIFPYESTGPEEGYLQPASKLPGGFLLVSREACEKVAAMCQSFMLEHDGSVRDTPHVFDIAFTPDADNPGKFRLLGEDFLFTQRLLEAGYQPYARTDITFSHIGRMACSGRLNTTLKLIAADKAAEELNLQE